MERRRKHQAYGGIQSREHCWRIFPSCDGCLAQAGLQELREQQGMAGTGQELREQGMAGQELREQGMAGMELREQGMAGMELREQQGMARTGQELREKQ